MSAPALTRVIVAALALMVAGVPVARRLCGLHCDALPASADARTPPARHCPAHPAPPLPTKPADPCGQTHTGDGALVTASASFARDARLSETPTDPAIPASGPSLAAACGWQAGYDRRLSVPPPADRRRILRL